MSDKIDFKSTIVEKDKDGHYILVKVSIQQKNTAILNIYAPNTGVPRFIKQTLLDLSKEINSNIVIARDFNTPLSELERSFKQKMKKETLDVNDTLQQMCLTFTEHFTLKLLNIHSFQQYMEEVSKTDNILGHKTCLNKFKKTEIIPGIFSDHSGIKLEINSKRNTQFYTKTWKSKNLLLNCYYWVNNKIKMEIKRFLELNNKGLNNKRDTSYQNLWDSAKAV